jgi:purine-nucleoside phosphorylase
MTTGHVFPAGADAGTLDASVDRACASLRQRGILEPQALFLLATGASTLATRLASLQRVAVSKVDGAPRAWRETTIYAGKLGELDVWLVDDAPGAAEEGGREEPGEPAWTRGFPVWLAARYGASVLVHASAGYALPGEKKIAAGTLALVRDHVNVSGRTPLLALGASELGPLFPDTSQLHDVSLRESALALAKKLGFPAVEAVAACVAGPCLETAAERAFWAKAGADVAVQDLQNPLIAAAHAGFAALAVVCVTDAGEGATDVQGIVARSDPHAAALEDLLVGLAGDVAAIAARAGVEEG